MKASVAEFLLEVGCEEIPAGMIASAVRELQVILEKYLEAENLLDGCHVEAFGAPRRLVAVCKKLRVRQPDIFKEVSGPPKAIAFDAEGRPTRAAESFAAKQGVSVADLYVVSSARGEHMVARHSVKGRAAAERLAEIVPLVVGEIPWPRTMYWTGADGLRFIRPIRWVVAILGGKAIRLKIGDVASAAKTAGHRFLGKSQIAVRGVDDYLKKLRSNYVLARPEERRKKVQKELVRLGSRKGLRLNDDPGLTELVVYLNEYPTAILGDFDPSYLELAEEILITVMRGHQKYFALRRKDGRLAPHFMAVINLDGDPKGLVRAGHERVLRARFADARFFWEADQRCRLADYLPKLARVTFQTKLGTYGEKVERVRALSRWLAEQLFARGIHQAHVADVDRAAELAKCDLVTEMVREFTELQGVVGGLYAMAQGELEEVAWAVYDHYKPSGIDDQRPRNLTGCIVSLADKLDTLVACFAVGMIPSGSSDPFALRRSALGIVKIILESELPVSLVEAIGAAASGVTVQKPNIKVTDETIKNILAFLVDRARYILIEREGKAYDEVNAALASGSDDLVDAVERVKALHAIRKGRDFESLAISFKRIRKILEKAGPRENWLLPAVRPELFQEEAERKLHQASRRVSLQAEEHRKARRYREAMRGIAELRPAVDQFFDRVLVMADQEDIRQNRLTLLAELLSEFSTIADFSELAAGDR